MPWKTIIELIIAVGLPAAVKLIKHWSASDDPTAVDWQALEVLSQQTARSKLEERLTARGIALDSPQAVELLSLLP